MVKFQIGKAYQHKTFNKIFCLVLFIVQDKFVVFVSNKKSKTKEFQALNPERCEEWKLLDEKKAKEAFSSIQERLHYSGFEVGKVYQNTANDKVMMVIGVIEHPIKKLCFVTIENWYSKAQLFPVAECGTTGGWKEMDKEESEKYFSYKAPFQDENNGKNKT